MGIEKPYAVEDLELSVRFTLCFLLAEDRILMLHRKYPPNQGLWNGVGGKIKEGELPNDACLREVREETDYRLDHLDYAGVLTWEGFEIPSGGLFIYTSKVGQMKVSEGDTPEGTLKWHPRQWVLRSEKVVSNIHHFLPVILNGSVPQVYHFVYKDGAIESHSILPLPQKWQFD